MIGNPIVRTRLALLHRSVMASCQAAKRNQAICYPAIQQHRQIRAERKMFRDHLPRYKNNLKHLDPLTEMLTSEEIGKHVESLDDLWVRKLDIYKQYLPSTQKPVLLEALFNPENDIDALLRIIDDNLNSMSSFYVACSFEALDDMMRMEKCDIGTVIVSPEFKRLSTRALYKVRFFEADEVLKLIRCIATVRLPETSLLAQSGLQMARFLINDFNTDELETLSNCLESIEVIDNSPRSLLVALKQTIPIAQVYQLEENMITKSVDEERRLELESRCEDSNGNTRLRNIN